MPAPRKVRALGRKRAAPGPAGSPNRRAVRLAHDLVDAEDSWAPRALSRIAVSNGLPITPSEIIETFAGVTRKELVEVRRLGEPEVRGDLRGRAVGVRE